MQSTANRDRRGDVLFGRCCVVAAVRVRGVKFHGISSQQEGDDNDNDSDNDEQTKATISSHVTWEHRSQSLFGRFCFVVVVVVDCCRGQGLRQEVTTATMTTAAGAAVDDGGSVAGW